MSLPDIAFFSALAQIVVVNLLLAGDNAVVIALAARTLSPSLQRKAVFYGTVLAIVLRVGLTAGVVFLLQLPYLMLAGGALLLWIAWRLSLEEGDDEGSVDAAASLRAAVITILMADLVMSLDNVVAIAAIAKGVAHQYTLIALGLVISIPIVMGGAALLLGLIKRFPFIVWAGAWLVAYTGVELMAKDSRIEHGSVLHAVAPEHWMVVAWSAAVATALVGAALLHKHRRARRGDA